MSEPARDQEPASREAVILTLAAILLTVVHYRGRQPWLGPRYELYGWFASSIALLLVVPLLTIRFALRGRPAEFGLSLGRPGVWGRDLALAAAVLVPLAALASRLPALHPHYLPYRDALADRWLLVPITLGWGAYFFAWEFFFRGFLLMGLRPRFGRAAIFVQLVPFAMAHFGKPEMEAYASIPGGLCLAWIAWRGESFIWAWLLHWIVATTVNLCVVLWPLGARAG